MSIRKKGDGWEQHSDYVFIVFLAKASNSIFQEYLDLKDKANFFKFFLDLDEIIQLVKSKYKLTDEDWKIINERKQLLNVYKENEDQKLKAAAIAEITRMVQLFLRTNDIQVLAIYKEYERIAKRLLAETGDYTYIIHMIWKQEYDHVSTSDALLYPSCIR